MFFCFSGAITQMPSNTCIFPHLRHLQLLMNIQLEYANKVPNVVSSLMRAAPFLQKLEVHVSTILCHLLIDSWAQDMPSYRFHYFFMSHSIYLWTFVDFQEISLFIIHGFNFQCEFVGCYYFF